MLLALLFWAGVALADDRDAFLAWADALDPPSERPEIAQGYRFAAALFAPVAQAVRDVPGRVAVEEIGRSHRDAPLWAFHVRDPAVPVTRKVLVFANIHAMEWISSEVAVETLLYFARHPEPGTAVTVIPVLNPDGRDRVERDLVRGDLVRYRRGNHRNVDLNRDFAVHREATSPWRHVLPGYHATTTAPLSQPETRALDALAARERYDRAASLHAFGGFFFYPWAGRFQPPEDRRAFVALGREMERAQADRAYKTKQLGRYLFFFRAHGAEIDHLYREYGTLAFLVELTRSGLDPLKPRTLKTPFRWYNPPRAAPHVARGLRAMRALVIAPTPEGSDRDIPVERPLDDAP